MNDGHVHVEVAVDDDVSESCDPPKPRGEVLRQDTHRRQPVDCRAVVGHIVARAGRRAEPRVRRIAERRLVLVHGTEIDGDVHVTEWTRTARRR